MIRIIDKSHVRSLAYPSVAFTLILGVAAASVAAPLEDPHLITVPRTEAEADRIAAVVAPTEDFTKPERYEKRPGGAATSFKRVNSDVFSHASANMPFERELRFQVGNGFFRKLWVTAPASTQASDGLGPLYNARACQRCHIKDGRGHPSDGDVNSVSMLLRLSIPRGESDLSTERLAHLGAVPEPTYGTQLQDRSIPGVPAEGRMAMEYEEFTVELGGGERATLRRPTYRVMELGYGPLHPETMLSPRVAPPMIGLGLIEAVPETGILAAADPEDADGDGISGRPNRVWSAEFGQWMLGRFGWKAGAPTVRAQSAGAFSADIGLATSLHPDGWGECTPAQAACRAAPHGGSPQYAGLEVHDEVLDLVTFYARNLAVPARRDVGGARVLRGKTLFYRSGCAQCHRPKFVTHRLADRPEQSFQLIWPYSDFLLHDMGERLADGRPEWSATGREWRTAPLWGIGLTETVNGHSFFLHDGRARSLLEAVLWHGGEAEDAKERVRRMEPEDRNALITFLESL